MILLRDLPQRLLVARLRQPTPSLDKVRLTNLIMQAQFGAARRPIRTARPCRIPADQEGSLCRRRTQRRTAQPVHPGRRPSSPSTRSPPSPRNLIRIRAGGEGFDALNSNEATDKYVKLMFADPAHGLTPPYDLAELRENSPEKLPRNRTYTVREINEDEKWLSLDFVIHGDEGVAWPGQDRAAR